MRRRRVLGWRERGKEAPLCGAQNHGRIFLSLSFLLPHPVDSRQLVKQSLSQPVRLLSGRRSGGGGDAVTPLVAKFSCCFDDVSPPPPTPLYLDSGAVGRRMTGGEWAPLLRRPARQGRVPPPRKGIPLTGPVAASCAVTAVRPEVGVSLSSGPTCKFADQKCHLENVWPSSSDFPSFKLHMHPHSREPIKSLSLPLILCPRFCAYFPGLVVE